WASSLRYGQGRTLHAVRSDLGPGLLQIGFQCATGVQREHYGWRAAYPERTPASSRLGFPVTSSCKTVQAQHYVHTPHVNTHSAPVCRRDAHVLAILADDPIAAAGGDMPVGGSKRLTVYRGRVNILPKNATHLRRIRMLPIIA